MVKIIQIIGPSGTGKSTVTRMLEARLKSEGRNVERIHEPGPLRDFILQYRIRKDKNPWVEAALFASDRTVLYGTHPKTNEEDYVFVSDRGVYDSIVYQGLIGGIDLEMLKKMNEGVPWPDWAFALVVEGKKGHQRVVKAHQTSRTDEVSRNETGQRIDELTRAYMTLPDYFPDRKIHVLDTTKLNAEQVADQIIRRLREDSEWQ